MCKNKSLFYSSWVDNGILLVGQLLMSYSEFLQRFKIPVTPKEYAFIFDAVPTGSLTHLKNCNLTETDIISSEHIFIGDINIVNKPCTNRHIRDVLNCVTPPIGLYMGDLQWKKACCILNKYCINNKVKEVSFKILHRIYPVKEVLERFKINIDSTCVFCDSDRETIFHLFFHCNRSTLFWTDMQNFINRKMSTNVQINVFDVMLYFVFYGMDSNITYIIQLLIILGKFHIHKWKCSDSKQPAFVGFLLNSSSMAPYWKMSKTKKL